MCVCVWESSVCVCVCVTCEWNKSITGANLEGCAKASYDGVEVADGFGAKICEISRG